MRPDACRKPTRSISQSARSYANLLCIWRVCGNQACLRAKRCRGDGIDCMGRCMPLLPEKVSGFFFGLGECQEAGLSWEDALEELCEEWDAVGEWFVRVEDSLPSHARPRKEPATTKAST
jgi:hypothetical protein